MFRRKKQDVPNSHVLEELTKQNKKLREDLIKELKELNQKFDLSQGRKNVQVSKG